MGIEESQQKKKDPPPVMDDDFESDEWIERILSTGCAAENTRLNDCFREKKDWRACKVEMEAFRECWYRHGNQNRTGTKNT